MLVLARRNGESVRIGPDVVIRILAVRGTTVRIGIEAPRNIPVYRQELLRRDESRRDSGRLEHPPTRDCA